MPNLQKHELFEIIISSIQDLGWNVSLLNNGFTHPLFIQIDNGLDSIKLIIHVWNLTHGGGRARPVNEYRIQITGLENHRFVQQVGYKTLILGYWQEIGVFAGFDIRKHSHELGYSPSIQIREEALRTAIINGFAPCDKGNEEIAVALRPDFLVEYIRTLESLHSFGQEENGIEILEDLSINAEINHAEINVLNAERQRTIVSINKAIRDASFKRRVLNAYNHKCAFCGIQLRLVEAAHILPASIQGSTDETSNGVTLCALHHRAFDRSFVTFDENYSIIVNDSKVISMRNSHLVDGLETFRENLFSNIYTPVIINERPHVEYIRQANFVRGWVLEY